MITVVSHSTEVFICGGYNGEMILSDLWKINLQTFQWTKLPAIMPEPAYFHCAAVTPVSKISVTHISQLSHTITLICELNLEVFQCVPSGWLHVRPWWSDQHVWEQEDWLFVQSVVDGAQPAGTDLGETAENFPSCSPAVHPSAAQPGTDTLADSAAQIDRVQRLKEAACDGAASTLQRPSDKKAFVRTRKV